MLVGIVWYVHARKPNMNIYFRPLHLYNYVK